MASHALEKGDGEILLGIKAFSDLLSKLSIGKPDIRADLEPLSEDREESISGEVDKLELSAINLGNRDHVGRREEALVLGAIEDIHGGEPDRSGRFCGLIRFD